MPGMVLTLVVSLAALAGAAGGQDTRAHELIALAEQGASLPEGEIPAWKVRIASRQPEVESLLSALIAGDRTAEAMRLAIAMARFWGERDALGWHRRVLAMPSGNELPERIPLLLAASSRAFHGGDQVTTRRWAQEALDLARRHGDKKRMSTAYFRLSQVALREHDLGAFHRENDAMLAVCREMADPACEVNVRNMAGEAARVERKLDLAADMNQRNLAFGTEHGPASAVRNATFNLAFIDLARGRTPDVRRRLTEAMVMFRATQNDATLAVAVAGMAMLAHLEHDPLRAARLLGAAMAKLEELGAIPDPADQVQIRDFAHRLQRELGRRRFRDTFASGKRLRFDDALEEAMRPGQTR